MAKRKSRRPAKPPEWVVVAGRKIAREFAGVVHARKRLVWILESSSGYGFAAFDSEEELESWWVQFQRWNGRTPTTLTSGAVEMTSEQKSDQVAAVQGKKSKKKASGGKLAGRKARPRRGRRRSVGNSGHDNKEFSDRKASEYQKPMSINYDMPEYDTEHFGRM